MANEKSTFLNWVGFKEGETSTQNSVDRIRELEAQLSDLRSRRDITSLSKEEFEILATETAMVMIKSAQAREQKASSSAERVVGEASRTAREALESAERTGGSAALTDCDVKMVVVLELLTQLSIKQLSSMISVALSDWESGSNLSYLPNLQKTYILNILVNIRKFTCVKVESHIRNCIPQHRFHYLFRHSILLLYKRKIIIANRATLFK